MKSCRSCHKELHLTLFKKHSRSKDGYDTICKKCHGDQTRQWQRNSYSTPEGKQALNKRRRKRRAVKLSLPYVAYSSQDIYERDNGVCVLCGFDVERDVYHIEHIVPLQVDSQLLLSYGITEHPGDTPWNVSVAHPSCNSSKGNRMSQEDAARYVLWSHLYKEQHVTEA